jgi:hypothetical protein
MFMKSYHALKSHYVRLSWYFKTQHSLNAPSKTFGMLMAHFFLQTENSFGWQYGHDLSMVLNKKLRYGLANYYIIFLTMLSDIIFQWLVINDKHKSWAMN